MAKETVKEFETVERKRTVQYCDFCGVTEDQKSIIPIGINPQVETEKETEWSVVETYDDRTEAELEVQEKRFQQSVGKLSTSMGSIHGVGTRRTSTVEDAHVSAKTDWCVGCIEKFLDINIPEDEELTDIEFEEGGIVIDTTKEVTTIWPQVLPQWLGEESKWDAVLWGWKGKIAFWPAIPFFIIFGAGINSDEWKERAKGYFAASLGAWLWICIIFGVAISL